MFHENIVNLFDIKPENILINEEAIFKLLGYQNNFKEEFLTNTIQSCIKKCIHLIVPKGGYSIFKVSIKDWRQGFLEINSNRFLVEKIISSQLKNADYIAIFIATIGNGVEKLSETLFREGEPLEGYIINLIGSEAAESVAEIVHQNIENDMKHSGLNITNRFSPGYCNWNVDEQLKLFKLFPENCCGISLNSSALMNPVKSVSGIIGVGEKVNKKEYPCKSCDDKKCIYKDHFNY